MVSCRFKVVLIEYITFCGYLCLYKQNFAPEWKILDIRAEMDFEFIRANLLVQIDKLRPRERTWLEYILALLCVLGHITCHLSSLKYGIITMPTFCSFWGK